MSGWQLLGGLILLTLALAGLSLAIKEDGWVEALKMTIFALSLTGIIALAALLISGEIP